MVHNKKKRKVNDKISDLVKPKKKYLYACYCLRCNGKKVDSRTQKKHTKDKALWNSEESRKNQKNAIAARKHENPSGPSDIKPTVSKKQKKGKQKKDSHHDTSSHESNTTLNPNPNNEDDILTLPKSKSYSRFFASENDDLFNLMDDENNNDDDPCLSDNDGDEGRK